MAGSADGAREVVPGFDAAAPTARDCIVLVADVSGFTALTAELEARIGGRAADRLAAVMDGLLGSFADIVAAHGGAVVNVVGDAIQAAWTIEDARDRPARAGPAGHAAMAMLAHARDRGAAAAETGHAALPVRIGLAAGTLALLPLDIKAGGEESLVWGAALVDAAQATALAEPGSAVVHEHARTLFEGLFDGKAEGERWRLLRPRDSARGSLPRPPAARGAGAGVGPAAAWTAELRSATIMFVRLCRAEDVAHATPEQVRSRAALVRTVIAAHGGQLDNIHVDEKGMAAVAVFGLPPTPSAGAALRALGAANDLRAELRAHGIDVAIGVATGKVRAGVGDDRGRLRHTIYGGAANLAARCMQACRDDVLCDSATRTLAADAFAFLAPAAHALKGLGDSVQIFGVGEAQARLQPQTLSDATPIIGRREDIALIEAFVAGRTGRRVLLLDGQVGIGKSRLAGHAAAFAGQHGLAVLVCRADPLGGRTSLFAWRETATQLLREFAARRNLRLDDAQAALAEAVGETAALAPLTNPLFGRALGNTDAISDPEGRPRLARRLQAMVLAKLLGEAARLLVIDDAQWLDEASALLAADLVALHPPLRLLVVGHAPLAAMKAALAATLGDDALTTHTLAPLAREGTAALAAAMLGAVDAAHPLVDWLHARAGGNPLFSRELLRALPPDLVRGALASPGAWRDGELQLRALDLPQTVEDMALMRLESRPRPLEQLGVLKAASVIDGAFDRDALLALDVPVSDEALDATLAALVHDGLLEPDGSGWRFAQALLREAIYGSLPDAVRTDLHRKAVRYFEGLPRAQAGSVSAEIAHHWTRAGEPHRAFKPLRRAGAEAKRAGLYGDSLKFFEAALDIARSQEASTAAARLRLAQLHYDVCDAQHILGDHHKAVAPAIATLAGMWRGAPKDKLGWTAMTLREAALLGLVLLAPALYRRGRRSARTRARLRLGSLAASRLSDSMFNLEGTLPALACSLVAARAAERSGDLALTARPYALIGYVAGLLRLQRLARFLINRPIAACVRKNDLSSLHRVLFTKVFFAVSLGRWAEATPAFGEALALNARYRSERHHGLILTAIGFMHQFRGDFDAMRRTYDEVRALGVAASVDQFIEWAELVYGRLALYAGDPVAAEIHFANSRVILGRIREVQAVFIAETMGALAVLRQGRAEAVEPRAGELIARVRATPLQFGSTDAYGGLAEITHALLARFGPGSGNVRRRRAREAQARLRRCARLFPVGRPLAQLHEGQLACLSGKPRRAERCWRSGLAIAERLEMKYDAARLHAALAALPALPETARAEHAASAARLLRACGVDGVPPLPIALLA